MAAKKTAKKKTQSEPAEQVRASAANPAASLAGTTRQHVVALDGATIEVIDGARANVHVDLEGADQADLQTLIKALQGAVQETY